MHILLQLMRVLFFAVLSSTALSQSVRQPAVPLVTHDPYFSIWSMNDRLTDGPTRHWTGRDRRLTGLARIDGQSFRWMGGDPQSLPALKQIALTVTPTRLAFDKPGTWSQKYNLVWNRILGLNLFPPSVAQTEMRFYKAQLNPFGLPLDNRSTYTKLDWEVWTATLADNQEDFNALIAPLRRFINESPSRVPLTDWYWTLDGKQTGFQARSVVGGVYIPLIARAEMWKKWSAKAQQTLQH
jgi:hypothetical protein